MSQAGDGVKSARRDNLDECIFNWVQQRLAACVSALDRRETGIMGENLNQLLHFSPVPLPNPLLLPVLLSVPRGLLRVMTFEAVMKGIAEVETAV